MNPFEYYDGSDVIPKSAIRISPSQLARFFDDTANWYRETLLGEKPAFQGNTATHLGTCVHAAAQMLLQAGHIDHTQIQTYISSISDPEVDTQVIQSCYPAMVDTLTSDFLQGQLTYSNTSEMFAYHELLPNIYVGGSIDLYSNRAGGTITDYKTMGSLDRARVPTSFPRAYFFQQLTYAWLLRQQGKPVATLELAYVTRPNVGRYSETTGKPLKDYPSEFHMVRHAITTEDMDFIESNLKLIAESIQFAQSNPEHLYLLAQDRRLKPKPAPKLFKKEV